MALPVDYASDPELQSHYQTYRSFVRWAFVAAAHVLLILALLFIIERRRLLPAIAYSVGVVVITYVLFVYILKTPLQAGPLGF